MTDSRRPLVGLTVGRDLAHGGGAYLRIRGTYPRAIERGGGVPVLIPPMADAATLESLLAALDGIVFPGGADVDPARYGETPHPTTHVDDVLDRLELDAARWVSQRDVPILGICRGQQVLNVALGGTLIQDLPSAGHRSHTQAPPREELHHQLTVAPDSRLAQALGDTAFAVNSFHHQAVATLAPGLRPVAWSDDGILEGFESETHPWLLAVQFHPEDLVDFHAPSQRLFRALVDACCQHREMRITSRVSP